MMAPAMAPTMNSPIPGAGRSKDSDLVSVCHELLAHLQITKTEISTMQTCLKELVNIAKDLGPNWKISSFGSAASGFYTRFSDLDVTCYQVGEEPMPARDSLNYLLPLVQKDKLFEVTEVISSARVPILKMKYDQKLEVDVSFQNTEPLPNTQLLRAYARLSPVVRHLIILVKIWARAEGVCGAHDGHLSSYTFTLLTIYFLQVDPMVKLPCFPTAAFTGLKNIPAEATVEWSTGLTVEELMCRFFEFYTTSFYWGYEVASPRQGRRLYSNDPAFSQLAGRDSTAMLHIEDPFLLHRNLNIVLGLEQYQLLCTKLTNAHAAAQRGIAPEGLMSALASAKHQALPHQVQENPEANPSAGYPVKNGTNPVPYTGNPASKPKAKPKPKQTNAIANPPAVTRLIASQPSHCAPQPSQIPMTSLFRASK